MRGVVARKMRVLDQYGRQQMRVLRTYDGAAGGRRVASLHAPNVGVNTALIPDLEILRARTRALVRSNPLVRKCVRSLVANVIGTGIVPRWKLPDFDDENEQVQGRNQVLHQKLKQLWRRWVRRSDADGRTDFYGQTVLIARLWARTGEAIVRLRQRRPKDGLPVPFQLQVLAPDHLPVWKTEERANGNKIIAGIEYGPIGNRVAYWLHPTHPGETYGQRVDNQPVRVPAETVLHVFDPMEPGQVRGEPEGAASILPAHLLAGCTENWLEVQRTAGLFAGFFTNAEGTPPTPPGVGDDEDELLLDGEDDGLQVAYQPGSIGLAPPGYGVEWSKPPQLPNEYGVFTKVHAREVCGAWGVTYEQGTGDYEGITYSACRASNNEQHRESEQRQWTMFVPQLSQPVAEWFVTQAVLADKLLPELDQLTFFRDPEAYFDLRWIPQGWPMIDGEAEMNAFVLAKNEGIASRDGIIASQGWDAEEIDEERREGMLREQRLGLPSTVAPTPSASMRTPADRASARAVRDQPVGGARV